MVTFRAGWLFEQMDQRMTEDSRTFVFIQ